jgi:superfamily II helicase
MNAHVSEEDVPGSYSSVRVCRRCLTPLLMARDATARLSRADATKMVCADCAWDEEHGRGEIPVGDWPVPLAGPTAES